MVMNFKGLKKAASTSREKKKEQWPSSIPQSHDEYPKAQRSNDDDCTNATGDYGIILVKKYKKLHRSNSAVCEKTANVPNHRGVRPSQESNTINAPEGLLERFLAFAFCGACASEKYVLHEDSSAASTAVSEDTSTKSGSDSITQSNAILLRQNRFKEKEEQKLQEESILTDVSFLTDGSPRDLDLRDIDEGMPSSSHHGVKSLPAFRKPPVMRRSQADQPMPADLSKHTRKNPMWTKKMGSAFKKRKSNSSTRRKKKSYLI